MPDVFKVLRDLEMKIVGLDPNTDRMQEGFFVSYRAVGLPVHAEDFENPYSPLGANLDKNIAAVPPADPANAPKTGSGGLDSKAILSANIARSQQNYLNTFLLTDDKLRMNSNYQVMPQASKVSDSWWAIVTGANGVPATTTLSPELQAEYDAARAVLTDADGNETPAYRRYLELQEVHGDKVKDMNRAYAAAVSDPLKLQAWPMEGKAYQDDVDQAWDRWVGFGHKIEIENALATLAAQGTDPAIALIARNKKRFNNSLMQFQGIGQIPWTLMLPSTWYDPDNDDGWTEYSSSDFHSEFQAQSSSTSYGGGGGFTTGFWSASAGFEHAEERSDLHVQADDMEISFKYCAVDIKRPWLDASLLNLDNWFLVGDYDRGCISDGTFAQELPAGMTEPTFLPSVVTSLILVKDLTLRWSNWEQDWSQASSSTGANASIGYGPFSISGHYARGDAQESFSADAQTEGLCAHGIQVLGCISTINPLSPALDSSAFMGPHA